MKGAPFYRTLWRPLDLKASSPGENPNSLIPDEPTNLIWNAIRTGVSRQDDSSKTDASNYIPKWDSEAIPGVLSGPCQSTLSISVFEKSSPT